MARKVIKRINLVDVEYTAFQLAKKFMEINGFQLLMKVFINLLVKLLKVDPKKDMI